MQSFWSWCERHQVGLERGTWLLATFLLVRRWLLVFWLWPDSSIYLTAAMNFVRHGTLFIYANYPSGSFFPKTEIYADYPPGFPLFLVPFYFLTHSPMIAAAIAQSCALIGLSTAVLGAARALRLSIPWRLAALFYFTFFVSFRLIFASLLNEALYIGLSLGAFQFSLRATEEPDRRRWWVLAYLCVLASATVRWNGLANGAFLLFPILAHWRTRPNARTVGLLALAGLVAAAPNPIWFLRNSFYLHKGTGMHDVTHLPHIAWEKLWVPFENMALRWGFGHFWIFLLVLAFALSPAILARGRFRPLPYAMLAAGMLVQFLVIYLLTLVFSVTPLDDRYLSPSYGFFGLLIIFALNAYSQPWTLWRRLSPGLAILGVMALCLAELLIAQRSHGLNIRPRLPAEYYLWEELRDRPYAQAATHYFSDDDFLHQIFIEKPHRLVFSNHIRETNILDRFNNSGGPFFFVMQSGSEVQKFVERSFPSWKREKIAGFLLYFPGSQ